MYIIIKQYFSFITLTCPTIILRMRHYSSGVIMITIIPSSMVQQSNPWVFAIGPNNSRQACLVFVCRRRWSSFRHLHVAHSVKIMAMILMDGLPNWTVFVTFCIGVDMMRGLTMFQMNTLLLFPKLNSLAVSYKFKIPDAKCPGGRHHTKNVDIFMA